MLIQIFIFAATFVTFSRSAACLNIVYRRLSIGSFLRLLIQLRAVARDFFHSSARLVYSFGIGSVEHRENSIRICELASLNDAFESGFIDEQRPALMAESIVRYLNISVYLWLIAV